MKYRVAYNIDFGREKSSDVPWEELHGKHELRRIQLGTKTTRFPMDIEVLSGMMSVVQASRCYHPKGAIPARYVQFLHQTGVAGEP